MPTSTDPPRHPSPSLLALAIVHTVLFLASVVVTTLLAGGQHFPSPYAATDESLRWFAEHARALPAMAFLQLGAAVMLGLYAASASSRLAYLGAKAAGVHIAFFGGVAAATLLLASSALVWVLGQPAVAGTGALAHALHLMTFAMGGPAFVAAFGLLVAGLALVAGLHGFAPRWLMWPGLVVAACAELSSLTLLVAGAAYLLPVARFLGMAWMIAYGALLPKSR